MRDIRQEESWLWICRRLIFEANAKPVTYTQRLTETNLCGMKNSENAEGRAIFLDAKGNVQLIIHSALLDCSLCNILRLLHFTLPD